MQVRMKNACSFIDVSAFNDLNIIKVTAGISPPSWHKCLTLILKHLLSMQIY